MTTDWPRDPCPECERDRLASRLKPWCDHDPKPTKPVPTGDRT